jgi:hypothetical protein
MNDDDLLGLVRDRMTRARDDLGSVRMEQPVSAVLHRAGARRLRHRLYGAAAGAGTLAVALAVGLGAAGTGAGAGTATGIAAGRPSASATGTRNVHVNLDAWSVNTGADGSVTITVRQLLDKEELEAALAAAGIPAVVIFGGSCLFKDFGRASEPGRKLTGGDPRRWVKDLAIGHFLTLYPAGIPSGDDVVIEMSYGADGKKHGPVFGFRLALLPKGTALSCPDSAK